MPIGWIGRRRSDLVAPEAQQIAKLFSGEAEPAAAGRDGVQERLPVGRLKRIVQRSAAVRVDVDAVALQPVGACQRALVDGDVDAGAAQSLSQAEPADAAADDHDLE